MRLGRPLTLIAGVTAAAALAILGGPTNSPGAPAAAHAATACPATASTVLRTTPATYQRTVALTFDDGPSKWTPQILAVLKAKGVKATFFVTGAHVKANPQGAKAIVAAGHRLGNHTYTHPQNVPGASPRASFDAMSTAAQSQQMDTTTSSIVAATGTRPCFFRAPGGHHFAPTTVKLARARGMSVAHWTLDARDWAQPGYTSTYYQGIIVRNATTGTASTHRVVLLHDGKASPEPERVVSSNRANTVASLGRIIDWYKARGYVFTDPAGRRL